MSKFNVTIPAPYQGAGPRDVEVVADEFTVMHGDLLFSNFLEGDGSYESVRAFANGHWIEVDLKSR